MLTVVKTSDGIIELNYMWLPTWVGMNAHLKADIEKKLKDRFVGKPLNDKTLKEAHDEVSTYLVQKFPIPGLQGFLDALVCVEAG